MLLHLWDIEAAHHIHQPASPSRISFAPRHASAHAELGLTSDRFPQTGQRLSTVDNFHHWGVTAISFQPEREFRASGDEAGSLVLVEATPSPTPSHQPSW
jgi:WD40 repeat protein